MKILILILALLAVSSAEKWAVLVAGSKDYWNYRHQADVAHAYHILIQNGYKALDLDKDMAATATSVTLVFISAVLTGLSVYDDIAKHAGAGTLVPITGFANSVVAPAIEFKAEGYVTGMAAKMFSIAGPVIVYGTVASVIYGLILVIFNLA